MHGGVLWRPLASCVQAGLTRRILRLVVPLKEAHRVHVTSWSVCGQFAGGTQPL